MIWIADPLMSTKEKKWRAFGVNCGFYREKKHGLEFFFVDFWTYFEWAEWAHFRTKLQDYGFKITSDYP